MDKRLHGVLLTLWDFARDNPNYDRKLWGELQSLVSDLSTRNDVLCTIASEMVRTAESPGPEPDEAPISSPPRGYAMMFLRRELGRNTKLNLTRHRSDNPFMAIDVVADLEPAPTKIF